TLERANIAIFVETAFVMIRVAGAVPFAVLFAPQLLSGALLAYFYALWAGRLDFWDGRSTLSLGPYAEHRHFCQADDCFRHGSDDEATQTLAPVCPNHNHVGFQIGSQLSD